MKKIFYISTNNYKYNKFKENFNISSISIDQISEETPEIQAHNNKIVAEFSAKWAANKFQVPVIKEDIGMYINSLRGFPGPYLNHIEKWLETEGLLNLISKKNDRSAYWEFCISYCEPNSDPISFSTFPKGSISETAKGRGGWIADKIFIPEGETKTISEMIDDNTFHRDNYHYVQLIKYLKEKTTQS